MRRGPDAAFVKCLHFLRRYEVGYGAALRLATMQIPRKKCVPNNLETNTHRDRASIDPLLPHITLSRVGLRGRLI